MRQEIEALKSMPHQTRVVTETIQAKQDIYRTMCEPPSPVGTAVHIGHGFLVTAAHCVQIPRFLEALRLLSQPKVSLEIQWGAGDLNYEELSQRRRTYDVELVALAASIEARFAWPTSQGISFSASPSCKEDFAFLRVITAESKEKQKTFRFQHYLLPTRLPPTVEHEVGALCVNGHISAENYHSQYLFWLSLPGDKKATITVPEVMALLKKLHQGHIVAAKGRGWRSSQLLGFGDLDKRSDGHLAQANGPVLRHNCPTLAGASGGALFLYDTQEHIGIHTCTEHGPEKQGFPNQYLKTPAHKGAAVLWEGMLLDCFRDKIIPAVRASREYPEVTKSWMQLV